MIIVFFFVFLFVLFFVGMIFGYLCFGLCCELKWVFEVFWVGGIIVDEFEVMVIDFCVVICVWLCGLGLGVIDLLIFEVFLFYD